MSTLSKNLLTPEQYLDLERKAEFKSEYHQGEMFAMAGASEAHNLIVTNCVVALGQQLRSRPCRLYSSDMRVRVSATGLYTYPDVVVVCGEPRFLDNHRDTLLNPTLIIEVLSRSTEAYDRGRKFEHYSSVESLGEYLLLSSDRMHADLCSRQPNSKWLRTLAGQPGDVIELSAAGCTLTLGDVYEKVEFGDPEE